MKTTVNESQFRDAFMRMGRKDNFSYQGLSVLWEYFKAYEEDTGEEIELDVIGICCEFSEETPEEIRANYNIEGDVMEYLLDHTQVAGVTVYGNIIYAAF
jgi:hypothetical protein